MKLYCASCEETIGVTEDSVTIADPIFCSESCLEAGIPLDEDEEEEDEEDVLEEEDEEETK